jgi:O-antigen/teichoic acid export membrane protein
MLNRAEVDRATFYALLLRGWQLAGGAVSVVLIGWSFSRAVQGYYYTFWSLLALQTFFELGMCLVIISAASHEWSKLRLDERGEIAGDPAALSRLVSLGRWIGVWYGGLALAFTLVVGVAGVVFFSLKPTPGVSWFWPWLLLVALSGGLLWTLPWNALLEGCNQVTAVNRFRLWQAIAANLTVWAAISWGAGLWAAVATAVVRLAAELYFLGWRYRRFFRPFRRPAAGPRIDWRADIWPMQWRIAISGTFSYFEYFLFTPILFYYHGPVLAGQMGMTWTLVTALQGAALAWVQARAPLFGMLVARRDYRELDRVYFRLTGISLAALAVGCCAAWGLVWGLYWSKLWLAERLLPPAATAIFLAATVLYQWPRCQDFYLRAHKREPLWWLNAISSVLIGLFVWQFGARYGATGAAIGYAAAVLVFILPGKMVLWEHCRRDWHGG